MHSERPVCVVRCRGRYCPRLATPWPPSSAHHLLGRRLGLPSLARRLQHLWPAQVRSAPWPRAHPPRAHHPPVHPTTVRLVPSPPTRAPHRIAACRSMPTDARRSWRKPPARTSRPVALHPAPGQYQHHAPQVMADLLCCPWCHSGRARPALSCRHCRQMSIIHIVAEDASGRQDRYLVL